MSVSEHGLSGDLLEVVFPFHLALDHDLRVRKVGPALARICPQVTVGTPLDSIIEVVSPRGATTFSSFEAHPRSLFLLRILDGDLTLRGQMVHDVSDRSMLFVGSPWIDALPSMARLGLTLEDFAVWDGLVDYLLLQQTQEQALAQARELADRLQQSSVELRHQAFHDALTGLPNRRLLAQRFEEALQAGELTRRRTALLLIDLDRFKEINDTFGYHYGDELLVQVGARLRSALREVDTVARLGGDEFAVLLPGVAGEDDAVAVADKLCKTLEVSFVIHGVHLDVEASIGVVVSGEHGRDTTTLLKRADIAMYVAKSRGASVFAYASSDDRHRPTDLLLLGDLRRAIDAGELVVHFQPKVSLSTGDVVGAEALVRWQHPQRGLLAPDAFIPLAQHTGLIGPLTRHVLSAALAQARRWRDTGRELTIAVNLSARNLLDNDFPDQVADLLAAHGVPADQLVLEITETAIMTEPVRAQRLLTRLSRLGARLSIDDFGAGFTSLGQLKTLTIHELKIDRSFVTTMTDDRSNALIVHSVVDLGHNFGLTIVAEGVETESTMTALAAVGCDTAQGYHIGRPMNAPAFDLWLASGRHCVDVAGAALPGGFGRSRGSSAVGTPAP